MPKRADDKRDPLASDLIGKLLDIGISLHDREVARSERWKAWVPLAVAIVAGLFTVAAAILKADSDTAAPKAISATPPPAAAVATP